MENQNDLDNIQEFSDKEIQSVIDEIELKSLEDTALIILKERKLRDEAEKNALFDKLTGLPNKAGFEYYTKIALSHAERNSEEICVGVVDVDNFKAGINDK